MTNELESGVLGKEGSRPSCATDKNVSGCPATLINLASNEFERAVVLEFIEVEERCERRFSSIENKLDAIIKVFKYASAVITPILVAILIKVIINK